MKALIPQVVIHDYEGATTNNIKIGCSICGVISGRSQNLSIGNSCYNFLIDNAIDGIIGNDSYVFLIGQSYSFFIKNDSYEFSVKGGNYTIGSNAGRFNWLTGTANFEFKDGVQPDGEWLDVNAALADIGSANLTFLNDYTGDILLTYYSSGAPVVENLSNPGPA